MLRVLMTIVLPVAFPTLLYAGWVAAASRQQPSWHRFPWPVLAGAGILCLAAVLGFVTVHFRDGGAGTYVPPHLQGGEVVPGHMEPGGTRPP